MPDPVIRAALIKFSREEQVVANCARDGPLLNPQAREAVRVFLAPLGLHPTLLLLLPPLLRRCRRCCCRCLPCQPGSCLISVMLLRVRQPRMPVAPLHTVWHIRSRLLATGSCTHPSRRACSLRGALDGKLDGRGDALALVRAPAVAQVWLIVLHAFVPCRTVLFTGHTRAAMERAGIWEAVCELFLFMRAPYIFDDSIRYERKFA